MVFLPESKKPEDQMPGSPDSIKHLTDRTQHQIDKDIQMIHDYQTQSLAHVPQETEDFSNLKNRLARAIEEPLKQLTHLRNQIQQVREHPSFQQTFEWVRKLQEQREVYVDQVLMKIDDELKGVVHLEEASDWTAFGEIEGEILFMERELHHIHTDLTHLHLIGESDKQFLLGRLEGLLDHIENLNKDFLQYPLKTKARMQALKTGIFFSISRLRGY
jgi:hypothetical protein